jgi:Ca2+-binding RTX toxin-like protein
MGDRERVVMIEAMRQAAAIAMGRGGMPRCPWAVGLALLLAAAPLCAEEAPRPALQMPRLELFDGRFTLAPGGRIIVTGLSCADTLQGVEALSFTDGTVPVLSGADDSVRGSDGADSLNAGNGADTIAGAGGEDTLLGGAGDDVVSGGEGIDRMFGGNGADTLVGGAGADVISGQGGADVFLFAAIGDGIDRIVDFTQGGGLLATASRKDCRLVEQVG